MTSVGKHWMKCSSSHRYNGNNLQIGTGLILINKRRFKEQGRFTLCSSESVEQCHLAIPLPSYEYLQPSSPAASFWSLCVSRINILLVTALTSFDFARFSMIVLPTVINI